MVKTIINGVVYDYIQPVIASEHEHEAGEVDLSSVESRILANETSLANATSEKVSPTTIL